MDRGTPELLEGRQRPAPEFVPKSATRPAGIKSYKPKGGDPLKRGRPGQATKTNQDLAEHIAKDRNLAVDVKRSAIKEAAESMENVSLFKSPTHLGRQDSSMLRASLSNLAKYAEDSKLKADLRASKETQELRRTHHSPLRQSKEVALQYRSIDKGQVSVENDASSSKQREAAGEAGQEKPAPDLAEIAQEVRKSLVRDASVVHIPRGEPILMTDKS